MNSDDKRALKAQLMATLLAGSGERLQNHLRQATMHERDDSPIHFAERVANEILRRTVGSV